MAPTRITTDLDWEGTPVRLVRSTARTRTVSASWREGRLQVNVPARLPRAQEREWIARMVERAGRRPPVETREDGSGRSPGPASSRRGPRTAADDAALPDRASRLSAEFLDGAGPGPDPRPTSVTWSARQHRRWGSCTPSRGTIRLSTHLQGMPGWVVDAVLVHELAHLREAGHGPRFQALVDRFPRYREAMAFLAGVTYAPGRGLAAPAATPDGVPADDAAPARLGADWDGDVEED